MIRNSLLALCFVGVCQPALAQKFSQVLDGSATLTRGGRLYRAERNVRLYEGDILNIPERIQLIAPYGAATITKRKGLLKILLSRQEGCGIRVYIAYSGGIGANARPKSCPSSSIVFESLTTGVFFNPWINSRSGQLLPNTLIAQVTPSLTGASFEATDRGTTSVLAVQSGVVEAKSANAIVPVSEGMGNLTERDQPPGPALSLNEDLSAPSLRVVRVPTGIKVFAEISALNTVEVQGVKYLFGQTIPYPVSGNSLRVRIWNAVGTRSRLYVLPLPLRKT